MLHDQTHTAKQDFSKDHSSLKDSFVSMLEKTM